MKCWDLGSNQMMQVAQHDAPIQTCHWVKGSNYTCLMTGSWDKTLKFWDTRYTTEEKKQLLLSLFCIKFDSEEKSINWAKVYI